jgi:hypothetical protein
VTNLAVAKFFDTDIAISVAALAAMLTFVAAVAAIIYARRQLLLAQDASRIDLTFRLYDRQLTPEFARHIALTADFLTIDKQGDERLREVYARCRQWEAMSREEQAEVVMYLNHLEAVGGLYQLKRLDSDAAMRLFGYAAEVYWERAEWFVEFLRGPAGNKAFDKWEALARAHSCWKDKSH